MADNLFVLPKRRTVAPPIERFLDTAEELETEEVEDDVDDRKVTLPISQYQALSYALPEEDDIHHEQCIENTHEIDQCAKILLQPENQHLSFYFDRDSKLNRTLTPHDNLHFPTDYGTRLRQHEVTFSLADDMPHADCLLKPDAPHLSIEIPHEQLVNMFVRCKQHPHALSVLRINVKRIEYHHFPAHIPVLVQLQSHEQTAIRGIGATEKKWIHRDQTLVKNGAPPVRLHGLLIQGTTSSRENMRIYTPSPDTSLLRLEFQRTLLRNFSDCAVFFNDDHSMFYVPAFDKRHNRYPNLVSYYIHQHPEKMPEVQLFNNEQYYPFLPQRYQELCAKIRDEYSQNHDLMASLPDSSLKLTLTPLSLPQWNTAMSNRNKRREPTYLSFAITLEFTFLIL